MNKIEYEEFMKNSKKLSQESDQKPFFPKGKPNLRRNDDDDDSCWNVSRRNGKGCGSFDSDL